MPVSKNIHCLSFQDDIALLVCIIVIMALTVFVVVIKVRQLGPIPFSPFVFIKILNILDQIRNIIIIATVLDCIAGL